MTPYSIKRIDVTKVPVRRAAIENVIVPEPTLYKKYVAETKRTNPQTAARNRMLVFIAPLT